MNLFADAIAEAFHLLVSGDPFVYAAAWRSLWISSLAVMLAAFVGIPLAGFLAGNRTWWSRVVTTLARVGMAMPTVFLGVLLYGLFSRRGPLGPLEMLYTPWAICAGEFLLALPIVVALSHGALQALDPRVRETALTLGAGRWRRTVTYLSEARIGIILALLTSFARCVTELGIAMMVGGNIAGRTRTLATATAMETARGEFERSLAMGLLLMLLALLVTLAIILCGREDSR